MPALRGAYRCAEWMPAMKKMISLICALSLSGAASAASIDKREIEYPEGALGYGAIISNDLATAERQLGDYQTHRDDPARLINYGMVLARTGRPDKAAKQFRR